MGTIDFFYADLTSDYRVSEKLHIGLLMNVPKHGLCSILNILVVRLIYK